MPRGNKTQCGLWSWLGGRARGLNPRGRSWPGANGALASFRVSRSPGHLLGGASLCNFTQFKFNPVVPKHECVHTTTAERPCRRHCGPSMPVPPLLGIYPKKVKTLAQKDTCTPMFIAALFTIGKTWKNLSIHRWMNRE